MSKTSPDHGRREGSGASGVVRPSMFDLFSERGEGAVYRLKKRRQSLPDPSRYPGQSGTLRINYDPDSDAILR